MNCRKCDNNLDKRDIDVHEEKEGCIELVITCTECDHMIYTFVYAADFTDDE